jgi:DMSO/TMAO reductase YedYZ heme-binding membrane subunit
VKDPRFAKLMVLVNSAVPLACLGWDAYHDRLGANPVNFALKTTGMLTLVFLLLSLTVTPARKISGWNFLNNFRRMLGLYAFFYACLHFLIYFTLVQSLQVRAIVADVTQRPFIIFGMTGLLAMVPLALTSTTGMIRRLGAARWKRLHQLVYVAGIAGAIHYMYVGKVATLQPRIFAAVLVVLLGYRLIGHRLPTFRKRPPAARGAVSS